MVAAAGSFASKHPEAAAVGVALYCLVSDGVPCAIASAGAGTFSAGVSLATGHFSAGTALTDLLFFGPTGLSAGVESEALENMAKALGLTGAGLDVGLDATHH